MIMISSNFIFNFTIFCVIRVTAVRVRAVGAAVVDKLVILGILCLTSFILALGAVAVAKLVILGFRL